jgi:hypothetical protein
VQELLHRGLFDPQRLTGGPLSTLTGTVAGATGSKAQLDLLPMAPVAAGDQAGAALWRTQRYGRRGKRSKCSPAARQSGRRELRRPDGDAMDGYWRRGGELGEVDWRHPGSRGLSRMKKESRRSS